MRRLVVLAAACSLLAACAAPPAPPGEFGNNKTTFGGLLGGVAGGVEGAALFGGKHGPIGKGSTTQVAGAVGGTLLGALIGTNVGTSLDRADQMYLSRAQAQAGAAPIGQPISWSNPESGHSGSVVATREGRNGATGEYCREYQQTVAVGGEVQRAYGTACRQPDGAWRVVP